MPGGISALVFGALFDPGPAAFGRSCARLGLLRQAVLGRQVSMARSGTPHYAAARNSVSQWSYLKCATSSSSSTAIAFNS